MKKILTVIVAATLATGVGVIMLGLVLRIAAVDVPPVGRLYDVGGHRLHLDCRGEPNGNPTIVFESGAATPTPVYHHLAENLSKTHRFCMYDRAGLGWSEASGVPTEIPGVTEQLHSLIDAAGITKPFVLAGHSIAGLYMKSYIQRYPEDVLAVGFLDASHPEQRKIFGVPVEPDAALSFEQRALKVLIYLGVTRLYDPQMSPQIVEQFPPDVVAQFAHFNQSSAQVDAGFNEIAGIGQSMDLTPSDVEYGNLPVLVVSAGEAFELPPSFSISAQQAREAWLDLQTDLASLSTASTHIVMDSANHLSMVTDKANAHQVADYLRDLVVQTQTPVPDGQ